MNILPSQRIQKLPPYVFAQIDAIKQEALLQGKTLYPLGIGDPDLPTPDFVLDALAESARNPENQKYPSYIGKKAFRQAVSDWMQKRFGVLSHPEKEVLALIGSKEGIAHFPLAVLNPGDTALVPDVGYPVYSSSTLFAGGNAVEFSLDSQFFPDFGKLSVLAKKHSAKLLFLNYPNNPTAGSATLAFFEEAVAFARKHQLIICHDNAYSEIYFDQKKPPSILEVPGAKDLAIEFHSLSKTFNMTGFRVGFAVGNPQLIEYLSTIKTNMDSGVFNACQDASIRALNDTSDFSDQLRATYQERRDLLVPALKELGLECQMPESTFYVWAKVPHGFTSESYVMHLINKLGIISTPGTGFGKGGVGFVRFTLCMNLEMLKKVVQLLRTPL